jgi:uncharacterized protein YjbI with pentapeptide repeats
MNQSQQKIEKPKLIRGTENNNIKVSIIEDYSSFRDGCISDCKIEKQAASHVCFEGIAFKSVEFKNVVLNSLELTDVRFENCDLSNVDFYGAIIHRTEFVNCKLMGIKLSYATLQNICIQSCNGSFALMSCTQMKRVIFEESIFENSNFQDSRFIKVQFIRCNFKLSQMSGTSLLGIDLSDSNVEGLGIQLEDLRGAKVSPMQAVDFSKLLGLVVKE